MYSICGWLRSYKPSVYVLNEKESIVYEREMYRSCAWAARATPAKAPVSQIPSQYSISFCPGGI